MTPKRENAIQVVVEKVGRPVTVVGLALGFSEFAYAAIILLLAVLAPSAPQSAQGAEGGSIEVEFLLILGVAFLMVGLMSLPAAFFLRKLMMNRPAPMARPPQVHGLDAGDPALAPLVGAYRSWFAASLVGAAVGETPGIMGLVLLLLVWQQGPLLAMPAVVGIGFGLMLASMLGKLMLVPTASRLEAHLRALPEPEPSRLAARPQGDQTT